MKNPRVSVTLNYSDMEMLQYLSSKKRTSVSYLVKRIVEDWLKQYEEGTLMDRVEPKESRWLSWKADY
jgi:predicted DNA-binding protein